MFVSPIRRNNMDVIIIDKEEVLTTSCLLECELKNLKKVVSIP
jgi:hypothetical protein